MTQARTVGALRKLLWVVLFASVDEVAVPSVFDGVVCPPRHQLSYFRKLCVMHAYSCQYQAIFLLCKWAFVDIWIQVTMPTLPNLFWCPSSDEWCKRRPVSVAVFADKIYYEIVFLWARIQSLSKNHKNDTILWRNICIKYSSFLPPSTNCLCLWRFFAGQNKTWVFLLLLPSLPLNPCPDLGFS